MGRLNPRPKSPPRFLAGIQAVPVAVLWNTLLPPDAQRVLEQLTSTEGRLAVSVGILSITVTVSIAIAPFVVRRLAVYSREFVPAGRASDALDRAGEYIPTTLSGLVLRALQVGLLLVAAVSLLVVWGLVGIAVDILTLLGLSIPLLANVVTTAAIGLAAYVALDVLQDSIERFASDSDRITEHQKEIILRVGNISIIALFLASTLTIWGVDLSGLLVGAGFLGIVVGLAARQTLGSLIAGFVLMFSRPFTIGDWVEIGDQEGVVTEITIVNTRLENFDGETIVLPNDRVSNEPMINRSDRGSHRIRLDVGIDYATDTDRAIEVAQDAQGGPADYRRPAAPYHPQILRRFRYYPGDALLNRQADATPEVACNQCRRPRRQRRLRRGRHQDSLPTTGTLRARGNRRVPRPRRSNRASGRRRTEHRIRPGRVTQ